MKNDDLLLTLYKDAKQDSRNISLQKVQLVSRGLLGFSILITLLTFLALNYTKLFENMFVSAIIIIVSFLLILFITCYIYYVYYLHKMSGIHFITSLIIERKLYELYTKENKEKEAKDELKDEILNYLPLMRQINKSGLLNEKKLEKWFMHALNKQKEKNLEIFLNKKFKESIEDENITYDDTEKSITIKRDDNDAPRWVRM